MIVLISDDEGVFVLTLQPPLPESIGSMDSTAVWQTKSPPLDWKSDSRKDM